MNRKEERQLADWFIKIIERDRIAYAITKSRIDNLMKQINHPINKPS